MRQTERQQLFAQTPAMLGATDGSEDDSIPASFFELMVESIEQA